MSQNKSTQNDGESFNRTPGSASASLQVKHSRVQEQDSTGLSTLEGPLPRLLLTPWFLGTVLVLATVLAYLPVWRAGFIWDDDVYVIKNKLLTAPDGLWRIWFSQDSPSQYFPLVYTAFRFEHALWGLNPAGYHLVNLLFHVLNGLLVWRLFKQLRIPGAWLGAALFALHPVQVESVAWVTERKNVLTLFFILLSLLAWIEFIRGHKPSRLPPWALYLLALIAYQLALFSKTTACTLPAGLVLVLWLQKQPLTIRRWAQIAPFVFLGLCMGLLTMWWERHHIGTRGPDFAMSPLQRLLIASHGVWFYLGKLAWPFHLTFSYPRWLNNPASPLAYIWLVLGALLALAVWYVRRYLGRGPEVALVFFVATLLPTLGFVMLFTFRYTFVADHYQYIACLGPLGLAAAGLTSMTAGNWFPAIRTASSWLRPVACGALIIFLGALTWNQARAYKDLETLWRDTVKKNPDSWMARYNLSRDLLHRGKFDEALSEYREALNTGPDQVNGLVSLGNALFAKGRYDEAMDSYQRALALNPDCPEAHVNLGVILASRGRVDEAIAHDRRAIAVNPLLLNGRVNLAVALASKGQFDEALVHYQKALELNPDQPMTHINLAIALEGLGRTDEAAQHYEIAAQVVNEHAHNLVEQGRLDEAEAQYREAIRLLPRDATAHYGLGLLETRQGKKDAARQQFLEALRIRPAYSEAQRALRELGN